jgi:methylated-DNA-[protein]-cysteine S-methyltransferase
MERLRSPRTLEKLCGETIKHENQNRFGAVISSPVGEITLVAEESGLNLLHWGRYNIPVSWKNKIARKIIQDTESQLKEYFRGKRKSFDVPLNPKGTDFQVQVWNELKKIPYGQTLTYGEQAKRLNRPNATRAVGAANGKNPIGIIIPCHRVIGANGKLTGFAGGLDSKRLLLSLENSQSNLPGF